MDTIFMNFGNSKTSYPYRLLLNLSDKRNLKRSDKYAALSNLRISYTWKNMKRTYKNSRFKTSIPTQNENFKLHDESHSVSDIQYYLEYILKNLEKVLMIF